jgi:hypothetical protein
MIPDPLEKRVSLAVRIHSGGVELLDGEQLPAIKDGTIGELLVPAFAIKDERLLSHLSYRFDVEVLNAGTRLLAGLRPERTVPAISEAFRHDRLPMDFPAFAEIIIQKPLRLYARGAKRAMLQPCVCLIPALTEAPNGTTKSAVSVNHAYTLLSTAFETRRRSHTGNVFHTVFFRAADRRGNRTWEPLEMLRRRMEATFATRGQELTARRR